MFTDSHVHLTSPEMLEDIDDIIHRAKDAKVTKIVNICTDQASLDEGIKLQKHFPDLIINTGATTPHDVETEGEDLFCVFERAAREKKLAAIGETGLDYHYEHSDRKTQKVFLIRYLKLAKELSLPVVIHCREAFQDLFEIADSICSSHQMILHCFTGTMSEAEEILKRGWYLSLSGIVTFKRSDTLREIAKQVPLNQLLIETDAPYLAPQSKRGKRNEPAFVIEVAEMIAHVKGMTLEAVANQTTANAKQLFFS